MRRLWTILEKWNGNPEKNFRCGEERSADSFLPAVRLRCGYTLNTVYGSDATLTVGCGPKKLDRAELYHKGEICESGADVPLWHLIQQTIDFSIP